MDAPVTLRLDRETRERVARIARQKRISASDVIREAIDNWIKMYDVRVTPYEKASDLIGVVQSGGKTRSAHTGRQFKELLKNRRK
jgi:predicted DNA-binding protein